MSAPGETLLDTVRKTIRDHRMLTPADKILVAISGGPDSVCLLHVLLKLGYNVKAAHLDHQTREGASADDARFVADWTRSLNVVCHQESRPVAEEARDAGMTFEEYARRVRYEFLLETALRLNCAVLATGHHADDQAETVLMRVIRGTTPRGLSGIPPVRESRGVRIVRPLLGCTHEQILSYLDDCEVPYRRDASNEDRRYLRNRVRHQLLPELRAEYNGGIRDALVRLSEAQRTESDLLQNLADDFLLRCSREGGRIDRSCFASGHRALQRRAILTVAWKHGVGECPFDRVDAAVDFIVSGMTGRACDLGQGVLLRNGRTLTDVLTSPIVETDSAVVPLAIPGETRAFARRFHVRLLEAPPSEDLRRYCTPSRQVFDAAAVGSALAVRHRQPGDRFTPFGMKGSRKLQDYFTDLGLSAGERSEQLLLTANDRIVWVVGRAVDAGVAVTSATQALLEVEVLDATE